MVEKQALEGVLWPICSRWHVPLYVNKGYSSASAVKDLAEMLRTKQDEGEKELVLLYVGDHDPSGLDMPRDIEARLREFGVYVDVEGHRVALHKSQVKQYKLPVNPAKVTDSRAKAYIEEHGPKSWEVDALPPKEFNRIVESAIKEHVDLELYQAVKAEEDKMREKVRKFLKGMK